MVAILCVVLLCKHVRIYKKFLSFYVKINIWSMIKKIMQKQNARYFSEIGYRAAVSLNLKKK